MTYEQAGHGRAGLGIQTNEGEVLTLKDRVMHHTTTGLSTIEISSNTAIQLNAEFAKFFDNSDLKYKSYVLKNKNKDQLNRLKKLLDKHQIYYQSAKKGIAKGYLYSTQEEGKMEVTSSDLMIHTDQPKGKMVKVLFEPKAKLMDSLTYDITAWSLPYAYGFEAIASRTKLPSSNASKETNINNSIVKRAYAYISKWNSLEDATFLGALLQNNIVPRFSEKAFSIEGNSFERGSLIVLRSDNRNPEFYAKLIAIANQHQRSLTAVATGFSDSGVDFGSASVKPIHQQKITVLSGKATSSLSFGEVWHFFETQLNYPITNINAEDFSDTTLHSYDVIVLPSGSYRDILNTSMMTKLKKWMRNGGTLIAIGNALRSFADKDGFSLKVKKSAEKDEVDNLTPFADRERKSVANLITGSIFTSKIDSTHPLGFGYDSNYFSLKLSSTSYQYLAKGINVGYFDQMTKNVSGYAGSEAIKNVPKSLMLGEESFGKGSIVYMVDNPLFRSFWENGKLFMANAVFLLNSNTLK